MIFNFTDAAPMTEGRISYTGTKAFAKSGGAWEVAFTSSGTLRFAVPPGLVDIFLLGGGYDGADASYDASYIYSGKGGNGGKHRLLSGVSLQAGVDYTVTIGASDGAATSISGGSISESSDGSGYEQSAGGQAAKMQYAKSSAATKNKAGADGVHPWGTDASLISAYQGVKLGAAGGGGHAENGYAATSSITGCDNSGGATGGGRGGLSNTSNANRNGAAGSKPGAGGGGGFAHVNSSSSGWQGGTGGAGASGILMIRKHV